MHVYVSSVCACIHACGVSVHACVRACVLITVCVEPVLRGARMPLQFSKTVTGIGQAGIRPSIMKGTKRGEESRGYQSESRH